MLLDYLVISPSGIVLAQKHYGSRQVIQQPRMMGSLLTALMELCQNATTLPVTYIEFTQVAIALAVSPQSGVICATVHDVQDGETISRLCAQHVINMFVNQFSIADIKSAVNVSLFSTFGQNIQEELVSQITTSILELVSEEKAINSVALINKAEDSVIQYGSVTDELTIKANFDNINRKLLDAGQACALTSPIFTVETSLGIIQLRQLEKGKSIVFTLRKNTDTAVIYERLNRAVQMLKQAQQLFKHQ
ncbi:hypothetical protein MP228_010466 [Amoeboaphelidium protococcarum]|nr:hypothetical protein MP228_010466 [Amoeboaphelidium protococcarum]